MEPGTTTARLRLVEAMAVRQAMSPADVMAYDIETALLSTAHVLLEFEHYAECGVTWCGRHVDGFSSISDDVNTCPECAYVLDETRVSFGRSIAVSPLVIKRGAL